MDPGNGSPTVFPKAKPVVFQVSSGFTSSFPRGKFVPDLICQDLRRQLEEERQLVAWTIWGVEHRQE